MDVELGAEWRILSAYEKEAEPFGVGTREFERARSAPGADVGGLD
jgi:hypothetical protein